MSKEHKNPYRGGDYNKVFGFMQKKQVFTRQEVVDFTKGLGKSDEATEALVTVLMSPRKASERGDCRGNMSAQGHLYFMDKLNREVVKGVKGVQKFRLRWRDPILEARMRVEKIEVVPAKSAAPKVEAKVEAKGTAVKA